jgi:hypothetical protein
MVIKKYRALEEEFGRTGAIAILGACVAGTALPIPGSSIAPVYLAKAFMTVKRRLSGTPPLAESAPSVAAMVRAAKSIILAAYRMAGEEPPEIDESALRKAIRPAR